MGIRSKIKVQTKSYKKIWKRYKREQEQLGYQSHTVLARVSCLREFLSWLEVKGLREIEAVSSLEIKSYYEYISNRPSMKNTGFCLSYRSIQNHLKVVADIFTFLQNRGEIKVHPCSELLDIKCSLSKKVKQEKRVTREVRRAMSELEIKQLYEISEREVDRALLSLGYGCGLRVSEIVALNVVDIKMRNGLLIVRKGKGNKRRVIPLSLGVRKDLQAYYYGEREELKQGKDYGKEKENPFILHSRGGRMQKYTCNKRLQILIERTGNKQLIERGVTMHYLRHSIASHLLSRGMKINQVRIFLGHNQLESTQVYTHVSENQLKELFHETKEISTRKL